VRMGGWAVTDWAGLDGGGYGGVTGHAGGGVGGGAGNWGDRTHWTDLGEGGAAAAFTCLAIGHGAGGDDGGLQGHSESVEVLDLDIAGVVGGAGGGPAMRPVRAMAAISVGS